ncbi:hypothetical protein DFH07DRAFT_770748 [Mycena maculata]|uniref:Uncharacterized protein n=1 Tax=Mycena maculata TaxID=230809 RepID=A0AAD7JF19_9AGAR|nr:hypothetical protein DFH07DRAFT_770748 [Mycena maculata]
MLLAKGEVLTRHTRWLSPAVVARYTAKKPARLDRRMMSEFWQVPAFSAFSDTLKKTPSVKHSESMRFYVKRVTYRQYTDTGSYPPESRFEKHEPPRRTSGKGQQTINANKRQWLRGTHDRQTRWQARRECLSALSWSIIRKGDQDDTDGVDGPEVVSALRKPWLRRPGGVKGKGISDPRGSAVTQLLEAAKFKSTRQDGPVCSWVRD